LAAEAVYPMLHRRRRFRLPRPGARLRGLAILVVVGAALLAGLWWARRPAPVDPRAAVAEATANLAKGNYSAARNNALAASRADPGSAVAQLLLARAYLQLGDAPAAAGAIARAEALGARSSAILAEARLAAGDPTGARQATAKASAPNRAFAARIAARATAAAGDTVDAQAQLLRLVAEHPRDAAAWTDLGRLRLTADDIGGAADAAAVAVRLTPGEPAALTLQGEVVRTRFGLAAALPWFERALATDAYYPPALVEGAATLGDLGRAVDALALTRRLLAARPGDPRARYLQAVLAARAGEDDLARRLLATTGSALADLPGAQLLDGALAYRRGQYQQAASRWRELAISQPLSMTARRLLADAQFRAGDPRGALATLRPMLLRADADTYALTIGAASLALLGHADEAAQLRDRAASRPGPAAVFRPDTGLAALRAAAAGAATDPSYALGVIRGALAERQGPRALATARDLASAAPGAPAAQLALGDVLTGSGSADAATAAYRRAASLRFDTPTMLRLVDAQLRSGRRDEAAATLALFLGQNPEDVTARRLLGSWQLDTDPAAAIETLEGVRQRVGNRDADLLAKLALAYAADDDGDIAVRYGRAAHDLAPLSPAAADAYGVALAAAGDIAGARQLLGKAARLAPADPVIARHRRQLG
jgi:cellulose synthase operon protein C